MIYYQDTISIVLSTIFFKTLFSIGNVLCCGHAFMNNEPNSSLMPSNINKALLVGK